MGKTRQEIYLNYSETMRQAADIGTISGSLGDLIEGDITSVLKEIEISYRGGAGRIFDKKANDIKERLETCRSGLLKSSLVLKTLAEKIYNTEMEALMIAERRDYR